MVETHRSRFSTGVVHSFIPDQEDLDRIIELDLYVGISGSSVKTDANLEVIKNIPLDRLLFETGFCLSYECFYMV